MLGLARDDVAERAALLDVPDAPSSSRVADVDVDVDRSARAGRQHPSVRACFARECSGSRARSSSSRARRASGNVSLRLRPTMAKRTARTVKEYGRAGELRLLRWTAAGGFEAVALGPSTDGVKAARGDRR